MSTVTAATIVSNALTNLEVFANSYQPIVMADITADIVTA